MAADPIRGTTPPRKRRVCNPLPLCTACEVTTVAKEGARYCAECQAEKDDRDEMDHRQYLGTIST